MPAKKPKIKVDFDKESMYSKIMPTAAKVKEENANSQVESAIPVSMQNKDKKVYSTSGIHIAQEEKRTVLINLTEYAVNCRINEAFAKFKSCKCDRCMKDVAAIALNKLPAKYVVVEEDQIETIVEQYNLDVIPALVSAIMVVKANPRH